MLNDPITLMMPDGGTESIPDHGRYLLRLYLAAIGQTEISARHATDLDLIRKSTDGGSPMTQLIQCFLHGPVECGSFEQAETRTH